MPSWAQSASAAQNGLTQREQQRLPSLGLFSRSLSGDSPSLVEVMTASGSEVGAPTRLAPAEGTPGEGTPGDRDAAPGREGIEIDRLDAPGVESIGLLEPRDGGLGLGIWQGSRRATLLGLLDQMPAQAQSPTLNDLARRLLLTNATAPDDEAARERQARSLYLQESGLLDQEESRDGIPGGAGGADQGFETGFGPGRTTSTSLGPLPLQGEDAGQRPAFLEARARALYRLGDVSSLAALLRVAPQRLLTPELAQLRVESLMLGQEMDEACQLVESWVTATPDLAFWQKALAVCQLERGEIERARLTANLLRESRAREDTLFLSLIATIGDAAPRGSAADRNGAAETASQPSSHLASPHLASPHLASPALADLRELAPIDVNLLHYAPPARAPLVEAAVLAETMEDLALLNGLGRIGALPPGQRAAVDERLVAAGLPFGSRLRATYREISFAPDELDGAAALDETAPSAQAWRERALLLQAAERAEQTVVRAEILRVALERAAEQGEFLLMAEILRPQLIDLQPSQETVWFVGPAVRALYALDARERAAEWLTLARQEAILNPETAASLMALWPYARLYGVEAIIPNAGLASWRSTQAGPQSEIQALAGTQAYVQSVLQALGKIKADGWSELVLLDPGELEEEPQLPSATLLFALEEASQAGRRGESVLLSTLALADAPVAEAHPLVLSRVLAALDRVGLREDARRLAREAFLGRGI